MKCQKCGKNEANNHFTRVINGKKEELHLCSSCAKEEFPTFSPFGNEIIDAGSFLSGLFGGAPTGIKASNAEVCPSCGITFAEICEKGKIGCADCYNAFRPSLLRSVKQIHGTTAHTGKIPQRAGSEISKSRRIEKLETELSNAVMKQEFEQAAKLRDEIKELKGE